MVLGSCKHNGPSSFIIGGEFLDYLIDYYILEKYYLAYRVSELVRFLVDQPRYDLLVSSQVCFTYRKQRFTVTLTVRVHSHILSQNLSFQMFICSLLVWWTQNQYSFRKTWDYERLLKYMTTIKFQQLCCNLLQTAGVTVSDVVGWGNDGTWLLSFVTSRKWYFLSSSLHSSRSCRSGLVSLHSVAVGGGGGGR